MLLALTILLMIFSMMLTTPPRRRRRLRSESESSSDSDEIPTYAEGQRVRHFSNGNDQLQRPFDGFGTVRNGGCDFDIPKYIGSRTVSYLPINRNFVTVTPAHDPLRPEFAHSRLTGFNADDKQPSWSVLEIFFYV